MARRWLIELWKLFGILRKQPKSISWMTSVFFVILQAIPSEVGGEYRTLTKKSDVAFSPLVKRSVSTGCTPMKNPDSPNSFVWSDRSSSCFIVERSPIKRLIFRMYTHFINWSWFCAENWSSSHGSVVFLSSYFDRILGRCVLLSKYLLWPKLATSHGLTFKLLSLLIRSDCRLIPRRQLYIARLTASRQQSSSDPDISRPLPTSPDLPLSSWSYFRCPRYF